LSRYSGRLLSKTVSAPVHKEILEEIYEKLRDHLPTRALEHGIAQNSIFGDLPGCYIADNGRSVLLHGVAVGQAEWDGIQSKIHDGLAKELKIMVSLWTLKELSMDGLIGKYLFWLCEHELIIV